MKEGRTALVLCGGGVSAAAFEIGCLTALDRVLGAGFSNRFFDVYVGVSAGSIIAALLANGVPPAKLFTAIVEDQGSLLNFQRSDIYRADYRRSAAACWTAVRRLVATVRKTGTGALGLSLGELGNLLQEYLPSGLFSVEPLRDYLRRLFATEGLCDDFRGLGPALDIPAMDLDRGARVVFGADGHDDVPVSEAITASCCIPTFFRPHRIGDRYYIDGCVGGPISTSPCGREPRSFW